VCSPGDALYQVDVNLIYCTAEGRLNVLGGRILYLDVNMNNVLLKEDCASEWVSDSEWVCVQVSEWVCVIDWARECDSGLPAHTTGVVQTHRQWRLT